VALIFAGILFVTSRWKHGKVRRDPIQRELTANPPENPIFSYAISQDGKSLAYGDRENGLTLLQIDTGQTRPFPNTASPDPGDWFPDGSHLLVGRPTAANSTELWKMGTNGTTRKLLDATAFGALSPDGTRIVYTNSLPATEIWTMGPDGEDPRLIASADLGTEYHGVNWSPSGQRLLYLLDKGVTDKSHELNIETCNLDGGQRTVVLSDPRLGKTANGFSDVTWLADGRVLFSLPEPPPNEKDFNIWAIEVDPSNGRALGKPSRVTNWTGFSLNNFSHSADGKRLVFLKTHDRHVVKVSEILPNEKVADSSRRLSSDNWPSYLGEWTSDSLNVLFSSDRNGKRGIYKQNLHETSAHALISGSENYSGSEISPDGKWLFYTARASSEDNDPSARLMRMPLDGGPPSVVLPGLHGFSCSQLPANVCVVSELKGEKLVFSFFDPVNGLGREIARVQLRVQLKSDDYGCSLSPDGGRIAVVVWPENQIRLVSTQDGSVRILSLKDWDHLSGVSWSSKGKSVFVAGIKTNHSAILAIDMAGNVKILVPPKGNNELWYPLASPDGHYLAYDERENEANVVMLENF
jgi:Tol biopolymer transport system component